MNTHANNPTRPRRRALLVVVAAILALACVCPLTLPGGNATPSAPTVAAITAAPGGATQDPGGAVEATAEIPPTEVPRTVIPPTGEVGAAMHEVIADEIATPGQRNTTTFTAAPGQEFFFGVVQIVGDLAFTDWRVTDEAGAEVFNTCLGCGNPGVFTLTRGGIYTAIVGDDDEGLGQYQIVIASVRVHHFPITPGSPVSEAQLGPGAGNIETPGARDMYTFTASAGEELYFGMVEQNGVQLADVVLLDEDAVEVFWSCLGCGNPGVFLLERGGVYTLVIGSGTDLATGTYALAVVPVRTDTFAITPGETIADGFPGPGAGNIETPGARDVYTFTANPGQTLNFEVISQTGIPLVYWALVDEDGTELFNTCLGCGQPGVLTLERAGTYTMTVGGDTDIDTGTYQLSITPG